VNAQSASTTISLITREAIGIGKVVWQRILPESPVGAVVIGHPNGSMAFGVQIDQEDANKLGDLDEIGGLTFAIEQEPHAIPGEWFVIHAFDPDDAELFKPIVDALGSALSDSNNDRSAALVAMSEALSHWLRFLRGGRRGLSLERQVGLWGELYVLRKLALEQSWPTALSWWTGPSHAAHDFSMGTFAVEAKASKAGKSSVKISSLEQLDDDGLKSLYLLHLQLEPVTGKEGYTLVDIINSIRSDLQRHPQVIQYDFEARLIGSGYHEIHASKYRRRAYRWLSTVIYEVDDQFPRIIRSGVPAGVMDARYTLNLASASGNVRLIDEVGGAPRDILKACVS